MSAGNTLGPEWSWDCPECGTHVTSARINVPDSLDLSAPETVERLGALIDKHFSSGRHGLSYTACAQAIVMDFRAALRDRP